MDFIFLIPRSVRCPLMASSCPSRTPTSRSAENGNQGRTSCESHAQGLLGRLVALGGIRARDVHFCLVYRHVSPRGPWWGCHLKTEHCLKSPVGSHPSAGRGKAESVCVAQKGRLGRTFGFCSVLANYCLCIPNIPISVA